MNELDEEKTTLIMGGMLADDGAALAAQGVIDIRGAKLWEGGWFVGTMELYVGAAQFYGGWFGENLRSILMLF